MINARWENPGKNDLFVVSLVGDVLRAHAVGHSSIIAGAASGVVHRAQCVMSVIDLGL